MINFSFNINWPWFKYSDELSKTYFYKSWRVNKNKTLEVQLSRGGNNTLVGFDFSWDTRCDHAGVMLELNLFRHFFVIHFHDNRHWFYEKNRYVNYDDPEDVKEYHKGWNLPDGDDE